jgi:glycosyltransferase involved in cell wall biosynthesis
VPPPYPALAKPLRVLFFGTGVPLHGLPVLVAAVRACAGAVRLTVVGASRAERAAITRLPCAHVELGPLFANRQILAAALADCHVVAGVFGATAKAQRVVPFKVVHGLAAGRPVLTADTPALREFLTPGHDVLVAPAADVMRLAEVLRDLAASPDRLPTIAHHAHAAFTQHFAAPVLGAHLRGLLTAALAAAAAPAADDLVLAR